MGRGEAGDTVCVANLVMARRATTTGASFVATLSSPSAMHVPFLVCTPAGDLVRPATVLVNQTALVTPVMTHHLRGPVQHGVAEAVDGSPALRQHSPYLHGEMMLLLALHLPLELGYVEPSFPVDARLRTAARLAASEALDNATNGLPFAAVVPDYGVPAPAPAAAAR